MDPLVTIGQGQLRGAEKNGALSFKGIPYAAAPFGDNRFAAPQPGHVLVGDLQIAARHAPHHRGQVGKWPGNTEYHKTRRAEA